MASFTTVMSEFNDVSNARTFSVSGHSTVVPKLVIQKRKVAASATASAQSQIDVVYGTNDVNGVPLSSKVVMSAIVRNPLNGTSTDTDAALVVFRDLVASDEFTIMVNSQDYLA